MLLFITDSKDDSTVPKLGRMEGRIYRDKMEKVKDTMRMTMVL
jgi:hypothetical protein